MTNESIRLTIAELWTEELLAIVERAAASRLEMEIARDASRLVRTIDALEVPDRPQRKRTIALEEGSFW